MVIPRDCAHRKRRPSANPMRLKFETSSWRFGPDLTLNLAHLLRPDRSPEVNNNITSSLIKPTSTTLPPSPTSTATAILHHSLLTTFHELLLTVFYSIVLTCGHV